MANLVFTSTAGNAFTLADESNKDLYVPTGARQHPSLDIADIAFANTAGMEARIRGSQTSQSTALVREYGMGSEDCVKYGASIAALNTFIASVDTYRLNKLNLIGTITDNDGTFTGMLWQIYQATEPTLVNHLGTDKAFIRFRARFVRYTV